MMNTREQMECVFPFMRDRRKVLFKPDITKFIFEQEHESTRVEESINAEGKKSKRSTVTKETREKKVTLKVFGQTQEEDIEHFFEAFETLQRELQDIWMETSKAKDRDAKTLFAAMEKMLGGEALTEWHDILVVWDQDNNSSRTWEAFKTNVTTFILTKLCPEDAYDTQRRYMMERRMPDGMNVGDYYKRYCTHNRYLPYLLNYEQMKLWHPKADFSQWWKIGGFSDQETRGIINNRVPRVWQDQVAKTDIGHKLRNKEPLQTLVDHYETLQRLEQRGRTTARRTAAGRGGRGSPNYRHYYGFANYPRQQQFQSRQQFQRGFAWPNNPGRIQTYYRGTGTGRAQQNFRGGRGRGGSTYGGRFGQRQQPRSNQQPRQWHRPPMQPGRWQQQQRTNAPEAYFSEDTTQEQTTNDADDNEETFHETFQFDEGEGTTEDELISQWNEAFFSNEAEESFFGEQQEEEAQCGWQEEQDQFYYQPYDY